MRNEVVALENESYGMVPVGIPVSVGIVLCGYAVYNKVPAVLPVESAYDVKKRGLS